MFARTTTVRLGPPYRAPIISSPPLRFLHDRPSVDPVATQMINYALTHARSQNSDEAYAQGMLVMEQCISSQSSDNHVGDNSRGLVLLAMGNFGEAINKLQAVNALKQSSLTIKVAALEALVGLNLQRGEDDTSSVLADKCLELLEMNKSETDEVCNGVISTRAKIVKGLVELVRGNLESALMYGPKAMVEHSSSLIVGWEVYGKVEHGVSSSGGRSIGHFV